jgi:hypothetical protein
MTGEYDLEHTASKNRASDPYGIDTGRLCTDNNSSGSTDIHVYAAKPRGSDNYHAVPNNCHTISDHSAANGHATTVTAK